MLKWFADIVYDTITEGLVVIWYFHALFDFCSSECWTRLDKKRILASSSIGSNYSSKMVYIFWHLVRKSSNDTYFSFLYRCKSRVCSALEMLLVCVPSPEKWFLNAFTDILPYMYLTVSLVQYYNSFMLWMTPVSGELYGNHLHSNHL